MQSTVLGVRHCVVCMGRFALLRRRTAPCSITHRAVCRAPSHTVITRTARHTRFYATRHSRAFTVAAKAMMARS